LKENNYKNTKWAREILSLQRADGSFGFFHTLSNPTKAQPITTEQAIRRLRVLGFTGEDEPIERAMEYIEACLKGDIVIPDRREKHRDWDVFLRLMFASWIKSFYPNNSLAKEVAIQWANIIENSFRGEDYNHEVYIKTYFDTFKIVPRCGRLADFITYYQVLILQGMLKPDTERKVLNFIVNNETGIYYIYGSKILNLPRVFASKETSRYLSAVELLADYTYAKEILGFVVEWLFENKGEDGYWDMGAMSKDGIYYPLSDSWRSAETRKKDCTIRIENLLAKLM
jgi:hypothetical protein